MVEKKFIDAVGILSVSRYLFQSTYFFCMLLEKYDHRFVALMISSKMVGNREYFNKLVKISKDPVALQHLFTFLLHYEDETINLRDLPKTQYWRDLIYQTLPSEEKWLMKYIQHCEKSDKYTFHSNNEKNNYTFDIEFK